MFSHNIFDVIIVGAGISGLRCAEILSKKHLKVLVLEAEQEIGGRAKPHGAMWIHGDQNNPFLEDVVKPSGYETEEADFCSESADVSYYIDGKRLDVNETNELNQKYAELLGQLDSLELQEDQPLLTSVLHIIDELFDSDDKLKEVFTKLSLYRLAIYHGESIDAISTIGYKNEKYFEGRQLVIKEGTLFDVIKQHYQFLISQGKILLNSSVRSVEKPNDCKSITVTTHDNKQFYAKQVIITVSLGVLKAGTIHFSPELPDLKQRAIEKLGFGLLTKVQLHFDADFCPNERRFINILINDSMFSLIKIPRLDGSLILVAFAGGPYAHKIEESSVSLQYFIDQLEAALNQSFPNKAIRYSSYHCSFWSKEKTVCGAYSFDNYPLSNADQGVDNREAYSQSVSYGDNCHLHFAGEGTRGGEATVSCAYADASSAAKVVLTNQNTKSNY